MFAVWDMQQVYDMWLALAAQNRQTDGAVCSQPNPEEKFIAMPTDYAEPMVGQWFVYSLALKPKKDFKPVSSCVF